MRLVQEIFGVIGLVSGCQKLSIIFIELGRLELYHKKMYVVIYNSILPLSGIHC